MPVGALGLAFLVPLPAGAYCFTVVYLLTGTVSWLVLRRGLCNCWGWGTPSQFLSTTEHSPATLWLLVRGWDIVASCPFTLHIREAGEQDDLGSQAI